jgi:hypothetical protein
MIDFTNRKDVINKLSELKAKNLSHMTIERFAELSIGFKNSIINATEEERKTISEYLHPYCRPKDDNKCIFTDEFPILSWGLRHGTAIDSNTGFSWECYHYLNINGERKKYEVILQYHPDNYQIDGEE